MDSPGIESEEETKLKVDDDAIVFLRKRSESDAARYAAQLKPHVDLAQKRRRAADARRHSEYARLEKDKSRNSSTAKKPAENTGRSGEKPIRISRSQSRESKPEDACGCPRKGGAGGGCSMRKSKRSSRRRRRKRSCGPRRRRRRSSRRRRRRSRRSRSRRRRRRSCGRRRRSRRRRRRCR